MADYAVMPKADYLDACNAIREKTGGTNVIKSGEMGAKIRAISGSEEMKIVQVVVKGADPSACSVWDVSKNAWVNYTTGGVTVNVINYLAVRPKKEVMTPYESRVRLKNGTDYYCTFAGREEGAWTVGDMLDFAVLNFAYTSKDGALKVHYTPIKAEDIDYIYISSLVA